MQLLNKVIRSWSDLGFMKLSLVLVIIFCVSCSQQHFKEITALAQVNRGGSLQAERPECEIDTAEYELSTKILAYEVVDTTDVKFGFSLLSGFLKAFGLSLKSSKGQMTLAMDAVDGLQPQVTLASALGGAESKGTEFKAEIDLVRLFFDINYYYQTPLSKLTEKGLSDTFSKVSKQLNAIQTPWQTNVFLKPTEEVLIVPVGTLAGVKVGDEFKIYNVNYAWSGTPCASQLMMKLKTTPEPIAFAKAEQVEKNATSLRITKKSNVEDVRQGAVVEVVKTSQALKRSLRLGSMSSGKIIIGDKNEFNILSYTQEQIKSVVINNGFYIRK